MKYDEVPLLSRESQEEARNIGLLLRELRQAHRMRQSDVAARAGLSRSTVGLIEAGNVGRTLGQLLRYVRAVAPEASLRMVLCGGLQAVEAHRARLLARPVRPLTKKELKRLDF